MAPVTALALVLLGGASMLEARWPSPRRTAAASVFVSVATGLQLSMFLADLPSWPDSLLVPNPEMLGHVPAGRMSPLTAAGLLLAGLGLLFVGQSRQHRGARALAGPLACLVCLIGVVVALGYAYDTPLLYGGAVVPMAFSTALGVAFLGLALIGLSPRDNLPLRLVSGSSAKAQLLRAFLPLAPAVVVVDLALTQVHLSEAIHTALEGLLSAMVVAAVVFFAAHAVSRALDRAEAEREHARRDVDRLAAIVESSSDAIWAKGLDGTIIAWNPSAERLFGYSAEEAVGQSANMLLPPGAKDEVARILDRLTRGERIDHVETSRVRKGGSPVVAFLSESPLHDAQGRVVGVSAIARDVTEQRLTERALLESEQKLRALFDSDVVGILFGDIYGRILDVNDKLLRMTGYTRDDLGAGLRWTDLTPPEFLPLDEAGVAEARAGEPVHPTRSSASARTGRDSGSSWATCCWSPSGRGRSPSCSTSIPGSGRRTSCAIPRSVSPAYSTRA